MGADLSREAKVEGPLEAPRLLRIAVIIDSSRKIAPLEKHPQELDLLPYSIMDKIRFVVYQSE
jgi:hypothetical protein